MTALPKRRIDALRSGATQYFTGKPCPSGHLSARNARSANCLACSRIKKSEFKKQNKEKINAQNKKYRSENIERSRGWAKAFRERRPEQAAAISRRYRLANQQVHTAIEARRRASKKLRTPVWADVAAIKAIYLLAAAVSKSTGIHHDVDHIVPLSGALVSGLHVENNLQIIPLRANRSKGNRFDPGVRDFRVTARKA